MLKEWARALVSELFTHVIPVTNCNQFFQYDGTDLVSISVPPNTVAFDPDKRAAVLNPVGRSHTRTTVTQTPVAIPQVDQFSTIASLVNDIRVILNPTPRTPTRSALPNPAIAQSPVLLSPSQLTRFLSHAKTHLGVPDALVYEPMLRCKHYGPDILHKVQDSALEELGIQPSDVIRLKEGAVTWWNSPDAKRKRGNEEVPDAPPAKRLVAYERRFDEGGGNRFWGPPMVECDPFDTPEEKMWYECEAHNTWFPIPQGYTVIHDDVN
jgi:hypothetical protein